MSSGLDFFENAIELIKTLAIALNGVAFTWIIIITLDIIIIIEKMRTPIKKHILRRLVIPP